MRPGGGTAFGWDYAAGVDTRSNAVLPLRCKAQNYAWGKVGAASMVAQVKAVDPEFAVEPEQTYAEYWMGTHPNAPSAVVVEEGKHILRLAR